MSSSLNDPTVYYTLSSDSQGHDYHLHDAYNATAPNNLYLSTASYSSDNWQVFYQDDVYFFRNYDYGADYELGIDESVSRTQPQLLPASGALSQQWNMTLWSDGTRKITNMAIGEFQYLGVSMSTSNSVIPVLNTDEKGSHWTFDINSSAGETTDEMQAPIASIAVVSSAETSTAQPTQSSITSPTQPSIASSPAQSSTSSLSSGAIAGVVIGAVALLALTTLAIFFLFRRRRRRRNTPTHASLPSDSTPLNTEKDQHPVVEADSPRVPVEISTSGKPKFTYRAVELPS